MSNYLSIANNPILYGVTLILLGIVFVQAVIFIKMALKRANDVGIPKEKLVTAAKTAAITTVVPTIATVIALITLTPVLGLAFSWARLSVIGSLSYELMAAEIGATAAGVEMSSAAYGAEAFLASVLAMTIGSAPGLLITTFFYKKYKASVSKGIAKQGDKVFVNFLMTALMLGLFAPFIMGPALKGGVGLATILTSGVAMVIVGFCIKKFKMKWLNDFALSISMVAGMAAAIVISL